MPTSDHPNTPTTDTKLGGISWLISILLLLPLLYVLSLGPLAAYYGRTRMGAPRALEAFYSPITTLATVVPQFRSFVMWYIGLWLPTPPPPPATTPPATPRTSNNTTN